MAANLSESYEKVILVAAVLIALGLGTVVYLKAGKIEEDFPPAPAGNNPPPDNPREREIGAAIEDLGETHRFRESVVEGRRVQTFTGRPLFVKKGEDDVVDLGDPRYPPVHPPIPNEWWLRHELDPGYADSPERDPDEDGFANLEEFEAETDPNNLESHPPLIRKLRLADMKTVLYRLTYSGHTANGPVKPDDTFQFRLRTSGRPKSNTSDFMKAGAPGGASIFFRRDPAMLRFELIEVKFERRPDPQLGGMIKDVYTAIIADKRPNKAGRIYKVEKGESILIRDYTATFFLDAVNQGAVNFEVEENESFSLPYDPNAAEKPYVFRGVTDDREQAVVEWEEENETKRRLLPVPEKEE